MLIICTTHSQNVWVFPEFSALDFCMALNQFLGLDTGIPLQQRRPFHIKPQFSGGFPHSQNKLCDPELGIPLLRGLMVTYLPHCNRMCSNSDQLLVFCMCPWNASFLIPVNACLQYVISHQSMTKGGHTSSADIDVLSPLPALPSSLPEINPRGQVTQPRAPELRQASRAHCVL